MVVCESSINNIMGGIENTGGVTLHNHRKKLKQRFDIIKKLGQGTYGKVQLGINKETSQEVAIKTIKKCKIETEADLVRIRREIQIMSSVQHPNIIHIYEVFENREKMVLVMEYAAGGELYDYLSERKVLTEDEARRIFRQIATAVYYCHKHKICHRDLKLENILLDENGNAKIADFGLSNVFDERRLLSTFCGSPLYASPEIVKGISYHGPEVDCWSLGVLLYTLVYGAMPFDGSNFKRLVKQISQGNYFEPKKPSSASPLIREMLTVHPQKRADIEKICAHWWVNSNYPESCLDIAEELANQTPVRLDLLLSLVPPPPQVGSDKLVIAGEGTSGAPPSIPESSAPARSQSVGSLMDLAPAAERRIRDLVDENKSPKRKLEVTVSTENANMSNSGAKRKERLIHQRKEGISKKDDNVAASMGELSTYLNDTPAIDTDNKLSKNLTQTLVKEQETLADNDDFVEDPNLQGAACSELIEESKKNETKEKKKTVKSVKQKTVDSATAPLVVALESQNDKENKSNNIVEAEADKKDDTKIPVKKITKKIVVTKKKKEEKPEQITPAVQEESKQTTEVSKKEAMPPNKPMERRRSKIFETAEKFQNLLTNNDSKSSVLAEKPKKIFIPGVNVGGFKKEFERKASLTSTSPPDIKRVMSKKTVPVEVNKPEEIEKPSAKIEDIPDEEVVQSPNPPETETIKETSPELSPTSLVPENDQMQRKQNAVNIISNAITKDGTRKSKSRPCMIRKPPVPFGIHGRSASGSIGLIPSQFSPATSSIAKSPELSSPDENSVTSTAEITLKSATLPRRKTTKAEIQLNYPSPRPATMEFKTEVAHRIEGKPELKTQRSEIIVPVNNNNHIANRLRSTSLDPEVKPVESPKERIIPISFEKGDSNEKFDLQSPQAKPPMPKPFQTQRSVPAQRMGSISRQSTHDSDSEATVSENMEPIRKSPREYIIPIAVEGGGFVTPRAASLEPSDTTSGISSRRSMPRFGRTKRLGEDGSEEDMSFSSLHRHNSVGRDSDNEDSRREPFHMHRLRSSRPTRKATIEHADSLSSGEEDDDDGFEILTAENLFSTLLSRVRSLTQRLNVEDNGRLGFPNTRLLGNFDHGSNLWNMHNDALSRFAPMDRAFHREPSNTSVSSNRSVPWRRSVSKDLATDIDRVFGDTSTPSTTATLPRDKSKKSSKEAKSKLCDLDLSELKLSEEDALALSYLTPGLSRRIQNQLFSQLPTLRRDNSRKSQSSSASTINNHIKSKDYPFSDSDSELFADRIKYENGNDDDFVNEFNFPRPPKHSYSSSRASEYSPIAESPILETKFDTNKTEKPKIYRLEDIKKESGLYDKDKTEGYTKYTPFRHCCRSISLQEPSNSYSNPLYFRTTNFSSENFDTKYGGDKISKYNSSTSSRPYTSHSDEIQDLSSLRSTNNNSNRISRFGRPDYYDNCVYSKERKKREMETQKVLKEIRNKREHRDKYSSREKLSENGLSQEQKSVDTSLSSECSTVEKSSNNSEDNEERTIKREGKISKLMRPKSYPAECSNNVSKINENKSNVVLTPEPTLKSKLFKRSPSSDKSSPGKDTQPQDTKKHNNQFLNSIEKKIRSFYSETTDGKDKAKTDTSSRIQSTIRSLREQSEPRTTEHCVTESGLIKRAVSVEDCTVLKTKPSVKSNLQPSRKSVSKILGLFKKYEDKPDKPSSSNEETVTTTKKTKTNPDGTKKIKSIKASDKSKSNIKSKETTSKTDVATKKITSKTKTSSSKLPVSSSSRNSSAEPENDFDKTNSNINDKLTPSPLPVYKPLERNDLILNLNKTTEALQLKSYSDLLNDNHEENPVLISPCDDSNDSWSVYSDLHRQDMSPCSENKIFSEEESNESVIDRIRRKSFYCRFNEKKKPRKTSLVDYKNYDIPISTSAKSRSSGDGIHRYKSSANSNTYTPSTSSKETKLCKRALSLNDNDYNTHHTHRYRESCSNSNLTAEEKLLEAIDKNLNPRSKRSYLKTPTRFSERYSMSPPLDNESFTQPSSSFQQPNVDISTPM